MSTIDTTTTAITPATDAAAPGDTVAQNRVCPVLEAALIPEPPPEYRRSPSEVRQRGLRRIDTEHTALVEKGLEACADRGEQMAEDLGKNGPKAEQAAHLSNRLKRIAQLKMAMELLANYVSELEDIALNDAILFLERVNNRYEVAAAEVPGLAKIYGSIASLFALRSAKISAGIAKARELREAKEGKK
jgi:hypothetical protein